MEPLFETRIGAFVMRSKVWSSVYTEGVRASWPMSKISFFKDYLVLKVLYKTFEIKYTDIEYINKIITGIQIHHHAKDVDKYVYISGIGNGSILYKKLKKVIAEHNLKIRIED